MQVMFINPPASSGQAIASLLNHPRSPFTNVIWLAGYYPGWSEDGLRLGLEEKTDLTDDTGENLVVVKDPPMELAATLLRYSGLSKAYAFSGRFPGWAKEIRAGNPDLWAQTVDPIKNFDERLAPMRASPIDILSTARLMPEIRAYLI